MDALLPMPAAVVDSVLTQLDCCARHGQPAVRRVRFVLQSRPKLERRRAANPLAVAGRLAERGEKVRITRITGWPLCRRCARTRDGWLTTALVFLWGGLALIAGAVIVRAVSGPSAALGIPLYGGIVLAIAAPVPFVRSSLPRIVSAHTSDDGSAVVVRDPHPHFAAQARAALNDQAR